VADWGIKKWDNLSDRWPVDEEGKTVPPVFFEHVGGSQLDVDMAINLLDAYGIPTVLQYPNDGEFGKVMLGFPGGGVDVFVPETMLEDARNIVSGDIIADEEEEQ
jgi:predicted nucleotidyltransferase